MTASRTRTLSKSDFKLARTCDAKLWFRENGYPDNREFDAYLQLLAEGGFMVEALACAKYEDGIALEYGRDHEADARTTLELLSREAVTLFQATLVSGRRLARVDIVEKKGNIVRLVEVKAKSFDSGEHRASLDEGGKGIFRSRKKPYGVVSDWVEKIEDLAFQVLLLERALPNCTVIPFLALVDKSKRAQIDDIPRFFEIERREGRDGGSARIHSAKYTGTRADLPFLDLITEVDVSGEVALLRDGVEEAAARYEAILDAGFDVSWASRGAKCQRCEFRASESEPLNGFHHCWGELAHAKPHVLELFSIGKAKAPDKQPVVEHLIGQGKACLHDIPEEGLCRADGTIGPEAERQLRQIRHSRSGEVWIGPNLRSRIEELKYPLHFIDFEVARLALPYNSRMRPYGQLVFQWSCHTVDSPGATPVHSEWLNTSYEWPNKAFVTALRGAVGDEGTLVTWSPFEGGRLREIDRELAIFDERDTETVDWIARTMNGRIEDICKWATYDYYHPLMGGRTSIKVVMDALWQTDPRMREQFTEWTGLACSETEDPYHALPPLEINGRVCEVREGTGAIRGYEAMMYGVERHDAEAKARWAQLLRDYCRLDTLSMVLILEHWRRAVAS